MTSLSTIIPFLTPSTIVSVLSDMQASGQDWDDDEARRQLGDGLAALLGREEAALLLVRSGLETEVTFVFESAEDAEAFLRDWHREVDEGIALFTAKLNRLIEYAFQP